MVLQYALNNSGTAAVGLLAAWVLYLAGLVVYRLYFHPLAKYPGPFWGRVSNFYNYYHVLKGDRHLAYYRCHQKYGEFVRTQPNLVTANSTEAIKDIYGVNKNVQKAPFYRIFADGDKVNTFGAIDRAYHAHRRKIVAHAFTDNALRGQQDVIIRQVQRFCDSISGVTDVAAWGNYLAFDVMGELSFSKDFATVPGTSGYREMMENIQSAIVVRFLEGTLPFLRKMSLMKYLAPRDTRGEQKLREFAELNSREHRNAFIDRHDFLGYVESALDKDGQQQLSQGDQDVEARGFVVAGTDTTATQVSANVFYLATNPKTLARLTTEIRTKFPNSVNDIVLGPELDSCRYLHAVVDETLRISPSVPGILPRVVCKGGIHVAGNYFPEGVELAVPIYAVHHNPKYFPNPHRHMPERWLEEESGKGAVRAALDSFMSFSIGSRGCLGKRVAYTELHLAIARMVWMYDMKGVRLPKDERLGADVVEYPMVDHFTAVRDGPVVEFTRRTC